MYPAPAAGRGPAIASARRSVAMQATARTTGRSVIAVIARRRPMSYPSTRGAGRSCFAAEHDSQPP